MTQVNLKSSFLAVNVMIFPSNVCFYHEKVHFPKHSLSILFQDTGTALHAPFGNGGNQ